jgi:hypothetical protein
MKKKIVYIICALFVLGFAMSAHAQSGSQGISLTPTRVHLPLIPGKIYITRFTVVNNSTTALPLRVQFEPFALDDETGSTQFNTKPSIHSWSEISKTELLIAPQTQQTIDVKTHIPATVPLGGYSSMLFFTVISPQTHLAVQTQLGALMTADIGLNERINHARLHITSPFPFQFVDLNSTISFGVQNDSLSHINAKPIIQIASWGVPPASHMLEEKLIFPGHSRQWKSDLQFVPWRPYYTIRTVVALGGGAQVAERMVVFPVPVLVLLLSCTSIVLIGILIARRKNIRKALRALYET